MRAWFFPCKQWKVALFLFLACVVASPSEGQTMVPAPAAPVKPKPVPATVSPPLTPSDQLVQANHDLLELLKKQQAVLEDIQLDRRLMSRQIQLLEEHLTDTLQKNAELQSKNAGLQATLATRPAAPIPTSTAPDPQQPVAKTIPPPPVSYLPAPESEGAPGTLSWHRLFTFSGTDGKTSDSFKIEGTTWRVQWHNLDPPGDAYQNTSALFIHAFPKNDPIPQNVCSKLGTGGDSSELKGPGTFSLKVEASGGRWECAVEDFR